MEEEYSLPKIMELNKLLSSIEISTATNCEDVFQVIDFISDKTNRHCSTSNINFYFQTNTIHKQKERDKCKEKLCASTLNMAMNDKHINKIKRKSNFSALSPIFITDNHQCNMELCQLQSKLSEESSVGDYQHETAKEMVVRRRSDSEKLVKYNTMTKASKKKDNMCSNMTQDTLITCTVPNVLTSIPILSDHMHVQVPCSDERPEQTEKIVSSNVEVSVKRSLRKRVLPVEVKCGTEKRPKRKKLSIQEYYSDKKIKRLPSTLETIFEEPNNGRLMSARKFKRVFDFYEDISCVSKLKSKKRCLKAKKTVCGKKFLNRKKVTLSSFMKKLTNLENE